MRKVLLVLVVLVLAFVVFVATRPAESHVERSTVISAPADSIYTRIVDFHRWGEWSPWAKVDPAMKVDFSGAPAGTGAIYHWTGNSKVGEGRMTVTDTEAPSEVDIHLEFIKPFQSVSETKFALAPDAGGTKVTWAYDGKLNFIEKGMCLFMPMDKMLGPDFEKGLAQMKTASESAASVAPAAAVDSSAAAQ